VALGRAIPDEVIEEERPAAIAVPFAKWSSNVLGMDGRRSGGTLQSTAFDSVSVMNSASLRCVWWTGAVVPSGATPLK
jgi:hypothetical protein